MVKIPDKLRLGRKLEKDAEEVLNILEDAYEDLSENLNEKPQMFIRENPPTTDDFAPNLASFWLKTSGTRELYIMTNKTSSSATWVKIF